MSHCSKRNFIIYKKVLFTNNIEAYSGWRVENVLAQVNRSVERKKVSELVYLYDFSISLCSISWTFLCVGQFQEKETVFQVLYLECQGEEGPLSLF